MKNRPAATIVFSLLALAMPGASRAQSASPHAATSESAPRFFQQFITDAVIVQKQWYSGELRIERGAVPPIQDADGFLLIPIIAVSPVRDLEVGGKVSYIDFDLDHDILVDHGRRTFSGESGLGDLSLWGKYRFLDGPVMVTAGGSLDLPTGAENDGLGTGKLVPTIFGAVRAKVGDGAVLGDVGFRFNRDSTIIDTRFNGKTSTFIGGGYVWEPVQDLAVSGEVTVESERFDETDSDIRVTAGAQWLGIAHSVLRGAVAVGLSDGAPDFELILGYAYTF